MTDEATTKVANVKQMIALAKAFNQSKTKVASINGEIGERIAKAVENGNLHAKAFKFNCALARMFEKDDLKAREFWRNVMLYHEEFEKNGLFGEQHVGDIDEMAREAEQKEREAETEQAEANGKALLGVEETGGEPASTVFDRMRGEQLPSITVDAPSAGDVRKRYADREDSGSTSTKSDVERQSAVERYIVSLKQAVATTQAEAENWSKSNVERAQAVALAKAKALAEKDGKQLTAEQTQQVLALSAAEEQAKQRVDEIKRAQQELNAVTREFSSTMANALDQIIVRGKSAKDVLSDLLKTLASSALRGGLTGEGMFGQALGLTGKNGATGGLFGELFNGLGLGRTAGSSGAQSQNQGATTTGSPIGSVLGSLFGGSGAGNRSSGEVNVQAGVVNVNGSGSGFGLRGSDQAAATATEGQTNSSSSGLMEKMTSFMKDISSSLTKMFNQLASGLESLLSGLGSTLSSVVSGGSSALSGIGSLFSGFFADGGNIPAGSWGIAGEAGPEIISGPASVTPMSKLSAASANASSTQGNVFNFHFPAGTDPRSFQRSETQISAMVSRSISRGQRNL